MSYSFGDALLAFSGGAAKQYVKQEETKAKNAADMDKSIATMTSQALLQNMNTSYNTRAKANEEIRKQRERVEAVGGLDTVQGRIEYYKMHNDTTNLTENQIIERTANMDFSQVKLPEYQENDVIGSELLAGVSDERVRSTLQTMFNNTNQRIKRDSPVVDDQRVNFGVIDGKEYEGYKIQPTVAKWLDRGKSFVGVADNGDIIAQMGKDPVAMKSVLKQMNGKWYRVRGNSITPLTDVNKSSGPSWKLESKNVNTRDGGMDLLYSNVNDPTEVRSIFVPTKGKTASLDDVKVHEFESEDAETGEKTVHLVPYSERNPIELSMERSQAIVVPTSSSERTGLDTAIGDRETQAAYQQFSASEVSKSPEWGKMSTVQQQDFSRKVESAVAVEMASKRRAGQDGGSLYETRERVAKKELRRLQVKEKQGRMSPR